MNKKWKKINENEKKTPKIIDLKLKSLEDHRNIAFLRFFVLTGILCFFVSSCSPDYCVSSCSPEVRILRFFVLTAKLVGDRHPWLPTRRRLHDFHAVKHSWWMRRRERLREWGRVERISDEERDFVREERENEILWEARERLREWGREGWSKP